MPQPPTSNPSYAILPLLNKPKQSLMYDEEKYRTVLTEMNSNHFNKKNWLINNFELYKLTLNWPDNLPPINRSNLIKGTFRERFNSTYKEILSEFAYELNYEKRTLRIE